MIFPVIDCSFISLFMRLKAVMGNCNSLADHILVISKEFQLFHPFLYPPTPHVTTVQVHPSSFYPSTQVWMQTWWIRWVIQGFSSSIPMGLGCACQLQHCLYMSTSLPVNIPPPVIHRLILYLIINFFFHFWSPLQHFYLPFCTWPPPKQTTFVIPILLQPFPNSVLHIQAQHYIAPMVWFPRYSCPCKAPFPKRTSKLPLDSLVHSGFSLLTLYAFSDIPSCLCLDSAPGKYCLFSYKNCVKAHPVTHFSHSVLCSQHILFSCCCSVTNH